MARRLFQFAVLFALLAYACATPTLCTKPVPPSAALHPPCFVPDTISPGAQAYLKTHHATPRAPWNDKAAAKREIAAYSAALAPQSAAAAAQFLQDIRNETIGGVPVTIGTPHGMKQQNADKIIVFAHAGAFLKGSCHTMWHHTAMTAYLAGVKVLCFEYSLTSEATFPIQLNEALAVFKALISNNRYKPENIALWGASAGGGLVPALLMQAQQQKLPLPAALLLMSPWGDMTKSGDTMTTLNGYDPMLQYELTLQQPAMAYVNGDAKLLQDVRVSPLKAGIEAFKKFPPTLTQIGLRDSFLSQAIMMHRKLRAAGVDASFSPWEGMWHIFQGENQLPEAQEAHHENAAFLVKHLKLAARSE